MHIVLLGVGFKTSIVFDSFQILNDLTILQS